MKTLIPLFALVFLTSAEVILKNGRRYSPEEETVTDKHFMLISDDEGVLHFENLKLQPRDVVITPENITFYLYTDENPNGERISTDSLDDLIKSRYFDPTRKNVFTFHGWRSSYRSGVNVQTRAVIRSKGESINNFAVDWSGPANQFYTFTVWSIPLIGQIGGDYINQMIDHFNLDPSDFIFVAHSLGAHVAGCMGSNVNGEIDQIIGLDPAWPMYSLEIRDNRLDETDAKTVHIAHTNAGFQGFASSIGTADYYFNGGSKQAGCGPDITNSCSHGRALDYYIESIYTGGFRATQCTHPEDYESGACNGNNEVYFGGYPLDDTIFGDYYLNTAESSPFALG